LGISCLLSAQDSYCGMTPFIPAATPGIPRGSVSKNAVSFADPLSGRVGGLYRASDEPLKQ
jgi:hypothetical protein